MKPNKACFDRRGPARGGDGISAGGLNEECATVMGLIGMAFQTRSASGRPVGSPPEIDGSKRFPWLFDFYQIHARTDGAATRAQIAGPMVLALLEERFGLKFHHVSERQSVYRLTIARDGLKLRSAGECASQQAPQNPPPRPAGPRPPGCGSLSWSSDGATTSVEGRSVSLFALANTLSSMMDRPVTDHTGAEGLFDVSLKYSPDPGTASAHMRLPRPDEAPGPGIFSALQKAGLKLSAGQDSMDVVVIDHIEKPTEN